MSEDLFWLQLYRHLSLAVSTMHCDLQRKKQFSEKLIDLSRQSNKNLTGG